MTPVYQSRFASQVTVHLQNAIDYYDQLSPGLSDRFLEEFAAQVLSICINPYSHSVRYDDIRFALIKRFHYAIHFAINELSKEVVIFAVHSTYTNPDTHWKKPEEFE